MSCKRKENKFFIKPQSKQSFLHGIHPVPADPSVKTVVHWFKPDCLRLDDNPGLNNAVLSAWEHKLKFQAIFILDPWFGNKYHDRNDFSRNVMQFLFECLVDLDRQLLKFYGVKLRVYVGMPDDILRRLAVHWNVVKITFQSSKIFPEIIYYEESLIKQFRCNNVWAEGFSSHSLFDLNDLVNTCKKTIPTSFKKFELLAKKNNPTPPADFHKTLPHFDSISSGSFLDGIDFSMLEKYGFPKLDTLFKKEWKGGETEAQKKLSLLALIKSEEIANPYDMLMSKGGFSPYIRFGCISLKRLYYAVTISKPNSPVRLGKMINGLLRREHAIALGHFAQNMDRDESNDLCISIPWDNNPSYLMAFRKGVTGFPWIDAIIRQILQEGWACMDARKSIASFLTRGCLWISWVDGVKFFQEYMLDFELSVCVVDWMHSAKCFVEDEEDNFDPLEEGKKLDPEGKYIRQYIPELSTYPSEYIHNPWDLPLIDQMIAGRLIGEDYPKPIVNPKMIKMGNQRKSQKFIKK